MVYLSAAQQDAAHQLGLSELPAWASQREMSRALFGHEGYLRVLACEASYGVFVWATEFSNVHSTFEFEEHAIEVDGERYSNSEAYYQAMKSFGMPGHEQARRELAHADPAQAWQIGQEYPMRPDWSDQREAVMRKAVHAKFTQRPELMALLLATEDHPLVQIKPGDEFWGTGWDDQGQNRLGELLIALRDSQVVRGA